MTLLICSAVVIATDPTAENQVQWTKEMFEWGYRQVYEAQREWLAEQSRQAGYTCNLSDTDFTSPQMRVNLFMQCDRYYLGDAWTVFTWSGWVYVAREIKRLYPATLAPVNPPSSSDKMSPTQH